MGSSSKSSNTTTTNVENTNLQGVTGQNVIAGDGNSVTNISTDHGATAEAGATARTAINAHALNTSQLLDVAGGMFEQSSETARETLNTAESMAENSIYQSLSFANASQEQTNKLLSQAMEQTESASMGAMKAQATLSEKAMANAASLAEQTANNGQAIVANSMTKIMYALAGVTGLVVIVMMVKGKK